MALSPQKFREIVFQLLYSHDFGSDEEVAAVLMHQLEVTARTLREASAVKDQVAVHIEALDQVIRTHCKTYAFERIPRVERNIMRLAVYELLIATSIPPKVAIAEAMRLSRKFATAEAAGFVNAILDSILQEKVCLNTH